VHGSLYRQDGVSTVSCRMVTKANSGCCPRSTRYSHCRLHMWFPLILVQIADAAVNGGSKVEVVEFKHDFAQPSIVMIICYHVSRASLLTVGVLRLLVSMAPTRRTRALLSLVRGMPSWSIIKL
jgi:hypothetical protein